MRWSHIDEVLLRQAGNHWDCGLRQLVLPDVSRAWLEVLFQLVHLLLHSGVSQSPDVLLDGILGLLPDLLLSYFLAIGPGPGMRLLSSQWPRRPLLLLECRVRLRVLLVHWNLGRGELVLARSLVLLECLVVLESLRS